MPKLLIDFDFPTVTIGVPEFNIHDSGYEMQSTVRVPMGADETLNAFMQRVGEEVTRRLEVMFNI